MLLVTSNSNKLKEFQRYGLDLEMEQGRDLPEVSGTATEVAIYKALEAGTGRIVEDTILTIGDEEVVDIRWKLDQLSDDTEAIWKTTLAYNDGNSIKLYIGEIRGKIVTPTSVPEDAFGFDPFFVPEGKTITLYDLEAMGNKDDFSARFRAAQSILNNDISQEIKISSIPEWTGQYQNQ